MPYTRNPRVELAWLKENTRHVVIVMVCHPDFSISSGRLIDILQTGGYPLIATREFFNILWRELPRTGANKVRFLYCPHHDPYALQIYTILRWGGRKNAAISRTLVCPALEWAGPTCEMVFARLELYLQGDWARENSRKIVEAKIKEKNKERAIVERFITKDALTSKAEVHRSLDNMGYTEKDEHLRKEVAALRANNAVSLSRPALRST